MDVREAETTFVDAVVAAIAGYAIGVVIEMFFDPQDVHVNAYELMLPALLILLAAGLSVVGLAVALLRGSPGIRHILIGRAGMIALSLPVVSLQMASRACGTGGRRQSVRALPGSPSGTQSARRRRRLRFHRS